MHLKQSNSWAEYLDVVNCHTFNGFDWIDAVWIIQN